MEDAEAAIVDVWGLSACALLLHNSESNLVLSAAFLNPALKLRRIGSPSRRHSK